MPYLPLIFNYKPFYIQIGNDNAIDTSTQWGMIAKENPYVALPKPKEPYKNSWKDEDGDDEYNSVMKYEAFTFDVKFLIITKDTTAGAVTTKAVTILRNQMDSFFDTVKQGEFKIFDSYTGLGRQRVRYDGYKEDDFKERNGKARVEFTVTFKVNDPVTLMKMSGNSIVTV